jgi:serine protease Do
VTRFLLSSLLVVAGFVAGASLIGRVAPDDAAPVEPVTAPAVAAPPPLALPAQASIKAAVPAEVPVERTSVGPDFTRIAGRAVQAVANISSVRVVRRSNSPFADDPFFNYFFSDDFFGSRDRRSASLGSGVIVSPDGYIVTNSHVVGEHAREVTVALGDKREVPGTIVGSDPATDIALLKVDGKGLPTLAWGDSSTLQIGEWVLAIGSPFQLSQTVTAGIVSATGRANVGFAQYEDFIQTDAAINPGNSGGALINTRGELVGINTGIFSQSGGYQGIGFAVPSLLARRIVQDLIQYGEVRRGTIVGIDPFNMTPQIARELGVPTSDGVLVSRISSRAEAYQAGMRQYDVIVGFNGQKVSDLAQLFRLVSDAPVGKSARLRVQRGERTLDVDVPITSSARVRG